MVHASCVQLLDTASGASSATQSLQCVISIQCKEPQVSLGSMGYLIGLLDHHALIKALSWHEFACAQQEGGRSKRYLTGPTPAGT